MQAITALSAALSGDAGRAPGSAQARQNGRCRERTYVGWLSTSRSATRGTTGVPGSWQESRAHAGTLQTVFRTCAIGRHAAIVPPDVAQEFQARLPVQCRVMSVQDDVVGVWPARDK